MTTTPETPVGAESDRLSASARDHLWMHFTRLSAYEKAPVPVIVRGGRLQSSALASEIQPVIGRHFSCPT